MEWWRELSIAGTFALTVGMGSTLAIADTPSTSRRTVVSGGQEPARTTPDCAAVAVEQLARMKLRALVGQMVMVSTSSGSEVVADEIRRLVQDHKVGSVILVGEATPDVAARYNNQLQAWAASTKLQIPLLISADLEFGTAHKVRGGTVFPLQMGIGATRNIDHAATVARISAREAKAMGFNWTLSPVADVNTTADNPVIGVRSFGEKPRLVSKMIAEQVRTYRQEGIVATPKHFPGHGATEVDSHTGLPVEHYDREALERVHLAPFQAAIGAGADALMTAHVVLEAVDPYLPATLSRAVVTDLLRKDMAYRGVVVTDAMNMAAIAAHWGSARGAVLAAAAGADVIMSIGSFQDHIDTIEALVASVESGELPRRRVESAARRVLELKCRYGLAERRYVDASAAQALVGSRESKDEAARVALDTITLVENNGVLPLDPMEPQRLLVTGVAEIDRMARAIGRSSDAEVMTRQSSSVYPTAQDISEIVSLAQSVDRVIVTTYSREEPSYSQSLLVNQLIQTGTPVIAVSLGLPYDVEFYPDVDAYVASYAQGPWPYPNPTAVKAAVKVILGADPKGSLPVQVGDLYRPGRGLSYTR